MNLDTINIPPKKIELLRKKGINSVESLLYSEPKKYLFFDTIYTLEKTTELEQIILWKKPLAIIGICQSVDNQYKNGRSLIKIRVVEKETQKTLYINIIGEYQKLKYYQAFVEQEIIVGGVLQYSAEYHTFSMLNPLVFSGNIKKNNRIIPVYRKYKGISDEYYEGMIEKAIAEKGDLDYIPQEILKRYKLFSHKEAIKALHHPKSEKEITAARQRIVFDDMIYFTCKLEEQEKISNISSTYVVQTTTHMEDMICSLPFTLTKGQQNAINSMIQLAKDGKRISSLVQGDVGSGKTMVAFSMMLAMAQNGYQSILMAPTAVLARQHYLELQEKTARYGYKCVFLSNELKAAEKKKVLSSIKNNDCQFIVGTHSCIGKSVEYAKLGLVITDEEHKFGVLQREALINKAHEGVHSIMMSGTPIPRTLANTLYGNGTSVFTMELPSNRQPIQTAICSSDKPVFNWMLKEIQKGHQCYVVCPLIDKAEEESKMNGIASIEETYKKYTDFFSQYNIRIGIVTGKNTKTEQAEVLKEFSENKTQILMATTVIEVGVNVPNATVIVITGAERFGLATLHQLRGRVGRGSEKSYCILQKSANTNGGSNLEILCNETNGLEIAKEDLKNRGTGNLLGKEQSGRNKYIELMLQYPNMYEEVKKISKELCRNHTGKDIIKIYEKYYCDI